MDTSTSEEQLPRHVMKFCPRCASGEFACRENHSFSCGACGFEFFVNAAAAVVALIEDGEGRLLLTRRARDPEKGMLDLPGGFADPGESAEQALAREVKEELNLEVKGCDYFCSFPNTYPYGGIVYHTLDLAFTCTAMGLDAVRAADDVGGFLFLPPDRIPIGEIGFDSIRKVILRYIAFRKERSGRVRKP